MKRRCFEEASGWIRQSAFKAPVWKSADWDIFYSISMEKDQRSGADAGDDKLRVGARL